jgi:hypothetical protein
MLGCTAKTKQLCPSLLEESDEGFRFCKDRKRDPFHGRSVRMRGRNLRFYDLKSFNPELKDISSNSYDYHDSWETPPGGWTKRPTYQPRCSPVTAIDLCDNFNLDINGRKRKAWEAEDVLHTHAVHVRHDKYNKQRRTKDTLFDVPVIGFKILADNQELIKWVLNLNSKTTKTYKLSSVPGGRLRESAVCEGEAQKWTFDHYCRFCWSRWGKRCGTPSLAVHM